MATLRMTKGLATLVTISALLSAAQALKLTNCTQLHIPPGSVMAGRAAVSVEGFALFALSSHSTDPNAGLVDLYHGSSKTWSRGKLSQGRTNIATASWGPLAIFAGGTTNRGEPKSDRVDVWDSRTNTWSLHHMSIGRDLLGCGSNGNYTVFAGGSAPQANQSETDVVDIWNHATGEWSVAHLSQSRKKPMAVAAGTKIVIAGGEIGHVHSNRLGSYASSVDIFDTVTLRWSIANLSQPRQYFGAAAATPNLAVFGGGFADFDASRLGAGYRSDVVDIYHADTDSWSVAPPGSFSHNRSNLAAVNVAGRYVAFGSGNIDALAKLTYDFFDGVTGEWEASHGHVPGNPAVASIGNVALFANGDGSIDAIAVDGDCSAVA